MIEEAVRKAVEPKMTALFNEVRESYGADKCGYPSVPMGENSYADGPRVMICGKGGGSYGLGYARISGIGPESTLANIPEDHWYPEVHKVQKAFIEWGVKRYLSGEHQKTTERSNAHSMTVFRLSRCPFMESKIASCSILFTIESQR